jgi:GT2 family glycosyltransferase
MSEKSAIIYIVIPVHNRLEATRKCLESLRNQTYTAFRIILVDDGSADGTSKFVKENYPEVTVLTSDGNLWWTGAINLGIRYAMVRGVARDAILVINNDVEVYPDYLETLYRLWQSMPRTLIGSILVDIDNPAVIDNGGNIVNWWTAKFSVLNHGKRLDEFSKDHYVDVSFLTGRGTLIPLQVFYDIGLYDEKHFQQCGDTEFPVRAKNAGYRLIVSYDAVLKSYLTASDHINVSSYYTLRDVRNYFLGIRSNCRLRYRFFFSLKTAVDPCRFICFFTCDLVRITGHFCRSLKVFPKSSTELLR